MKQLLIIFTITLALISCGGEDTAQKQEKLKPVKYSEVSLFGGIQKKSFTGTSQSGSEAKLSFRANGIITKLNVKVGSRVRKGQLLAKLDSKDARLSYENALSSLKNSEIQLQTAKSALERTKKLYMTNNASLNDYEKAKSSFASARSGNESAQKKLDLQKSQLEYTKIVSPTNGVVTAVNSEINEFAGAGTPIIIINSGKDDMEVNVGIPEAYISQVKQGENVDVTFSSDVGTTYKGVITEVGFSTAGFLTYPVIVKVLNTKGNIRPGMPADIVFSFGSADNKSQLIVPVKAVGEDNTGNFVFVLNKKEGHYLVKKQNIKIGALSNRGFSVVEGVKEGDKVAIAGMRSLYDGRKVLLLEQ